MTELFEIEDDYERELIRLKIEDRADELGLKTKFNTLFRAKKKQMKEAMKAQKPAYAPHTNVTDFSCLEREGLEQLECGDWIADDKGIWTNTIAGPVYACRHPIYPVKELISSETGLCKVELHYLIRGKIKSLIVDKSTIASKSSIVKLADNQIDVDSNSASFLMRYLSDVLALNQETIQECASTSKLGWIRQKDQLTEKPKMFLPYDQDNIVFDSEQSVKSLFESIEEHGSRDAWYDIVKEIRQKHNNEIGIYFAASFASILLEHVNALPFIVSLWGGSGAGKTVSLMLATSVWANPAEGKYITDAKATTTAMEIRLNILNSLPMTLDDIAQIKNRYDDDFSQLIYQWCAGQGRERSNVNLGLNKQTSWKNCTLTNGERSLVDETTQGGAVNRVIDIEHKGEPLYPGNYGNKVANILRENYGFAGREFVDVVKHYDTMFPGDKISYQDGERTIICNSIADIMEKWEKAIKSRAEAQGEEKEDKQVMPMALILTADEMIEKYMFNDNVRIDLDYAISCLKNRGEVSENKRAYEYMCGVIEANQNHFADNKDELWERPTENWGFWVDGMDVVAIIPSVFNKLVKEGNFQAKAFRSWARDNGILQCDNGRFDKGYRRNGSVKRYVTFELNHDTDVGFKQVSDDELEELPFT